MKQKARQIKLLDKYEIEAIRKVTANRAKHTSKMFGTVRLPTWVAYNSEGETKPATGRATCRLCGTKIKHGLQLSFYYDEEQNAWTGKEYHVHADGCDS